MARGCGWWWWWSQFGWWRSLEWRLHDGGGGDGLMVAVVETDEIRVRF